jgi:hypothetical protein
MFANAVIPKTITSLYTSGLTAWMVKPRVTS